MKREGRLVRRGANGCRIHDDCLSCPLPACIEDMLPEEARRTIREHEDEKINQAFQEMTAQGMTQRQAVNRLAEKLGMKGPSSIYRRLKRRRLEGKTEGD